MRRHISPVAAATPETMAAKQKITPLPKKIVPLTKKIAPPPKKPLIVPLPKKKVRAPYFQKRPTRMPKAKNVVGPSNLLPCQDRRAKECAFVVTLWSQPKERNSVEEFVLLACVLGFSLKIHKSAHDRVALVTPDVLESPCAWILNRYWTDVQQIEHVEVHPKIVSGCNDRFSKVFTKFRALELPYKRIVLLDADLLLRKNVDMLMDFDPPAAFRRGHVHRTPGKIPAEQFLDQTGKQKYGINIGVCLLEPSPQEFKDICAILADPDHPEHLPSSGPEQDFITRRYMYAPGWTSLHMTFNYQLHQLLQGKKGSRNDRVTMLHEDVHISHFSTDCKPCDFLFQKGLPSYKEFLESFMAKFKSTVDEDIRERIDLSMQEWYEHFGRMWKDALQSVVGETVCKWCKAELINDDDKVEHCFLRCSSVRHWVDKWRSELKGFSPGMQTLTKPPPGTITATLNFVGKFYRRERYGIYPFDFEGNTRSLDNTDSGPLIKDEVTREDNSFHLQYANEEGPSRSGDKKKGEQITPPWKRKYEEEYEEEDSSWQASARRDNSFHHDEEEEDEEEEEEENEDRARSRHVVRGENLEPPWRQRTQLPHGVHQCHGVQLALVGGIVVIHFVVGSSILEQNAAWTLQMATGVAARAAGMLVDHPVVVDSAALGFPASGSRCVSLKGEPGIVGVGFNQRSCMLALVVALFKQRPELIESHTQTCRFVPELLDLVHCIADC